MPRALFALSLGLLSLRVLPALPPYWALALAALVGLAWVPSRLYPLGFFLLGLSWACCSAHWALDDRLTASLDGRTLWLQGRVVGLPDRQTEVVRFELVDGSSRRGKLPKRLRLAWYAGPELRAGERWRLAVQLERPHGLVNPAGLDYEAWLLARRIGATGTVKAGQRLTEAGGPPAWRDALRQAIVSQPAQGRGGGLAALVVGDPAGLSRTDWQLLQNTGTLHLMVISGEHVSMVAGLIYAVIAGLARRGWWPARWPWLPAACLLAFLGALGYGFLAGFEVPVRRACAMLGLVLLWRWRFVQLGVVTPLLAALALVLVLEPLASLQAGFWLSFAAVTLLLLAFGGRLGRWRLLASLWRSQWTVTLGLLPVLLALSLPLSLTAPLANLVAVPWVGVAVVPLALLGCLLLPVPWLGSSLLWLAGSLLAGLFVFLDRLAAQVPPWLPRALPFWAWLLVSLGCLCALLPKGVPGRVLAVCLLLLLWPPMERPERSRAEVWMLDVGQGLAVLVRTRQHALLYDAGPRLNDFDLGERVVAPSLRRLGVQALDLMLLSHADLDHAGGALAVQKVIPVRQVSSGEPEELPKALQAKACGGQRWQWDGVLFSTWRWGAARTGNASSCVLRVEANGEALLLTGDLDAAAERALLKTSLPLSAHWLQVAHHGSNSASGTAFLAAVAPAGALLSRGLGNSYGHPSPAVVGRLRRQGACLFDTASQGALRIGLGDWAPLRRYRDEVRFWRQKAPQEPLCGGAAMLE